MKNRPFTRVITEGLEVGLDAQGKPRVFVSLDDHDPDGGRVSLDPKAFSHFVPGFGLINGDGFSISRSTDDTRMGTISGTIAGEGVAFSVSFYLDYFQPLLDAIDDLKLVSEIWTELSGDHSDDLFDDVADALETHQDQQPRRRDRFRAA